MTPPHRKLCSLAEARQRFLDLLPGRPAAVEVVPLSAALGRVLAEDLVLDEDLPPADLSAMDGFAVRLADLPAAAPFTLRLAGESLAGRPAAEALPAGSCMRVMTGGLVPEGADAVVPVEETSGFAPDAEGRVTFHRLPGRGAHIRPRGGLRRRGARLVTAGTRIGPAQLGILAARGRAEVPVGARPKVAVLPTGDEIVAVEERPAPGQVRDSNARTVAAQAEAWGADVVVLPPVGDEPEALRSALAEARAERDLVVTIGGVSMGTKDYVRRIFAELGGQLGVEAVRIKPGKPTAAGRFADGPAFLGLPGNPASSLTIFALLGGPWLRLFQGESERRVLGPRRAPIRFSKIRPKDRLQALPGRLQARGGDLAVAQLRQVDSSDLYCFDGADVLILVPEGTAPRDGDLVDWLPLFGDFL